MQMLEITGRYAGCPEKKPLFIEFLSVIPNKNGYLKNILMKQISMAYNIKSMSIHSVSVSPLSPLSP